ncbi:MAG: 8-oxo-dGTP diphosphatase MutT, partial [Gammaproteobacteria bacterium]|nr:8-oxo-dGTP diphosphatase MutT [Gammaproteobacteria bacterium]
MPNTAADKPYTHVVAGIIRHPKHPHKLFITRRQQGQHLENLWEFPGGKLEPNESRFIGMRRELEEETGIRVESALPFFCVLHEYPDKNIFLDVWEVQSYRGKAHGREGQQGRWVKQSELTGLDFPAADIPIIQALSLPPELLITPDLAEAHQAGFIEHFRQLMQRHPYPL